MSFNFKYNSQLTTSLSIEVLDLTPTTDMYTLNLSILKIVGRITIKEMDLNNLVKGNKILSVIFISWVENIGLNIWNVIIYDLNL